MGKTRQTLVFLYGLMTAGTIKNALIVCPRSVTESAWQSEAQIIKVHFGLECKIELDVCYDASSTGKRSILQNAKYWSTILFAPLRTVSGAEPG